MGQTQADVLGEPRLFLFQDGPTLVELFVAPRPYEVELQFERWLEGETLRKVTVHRGEMSTIDYVTQMDGWRRDAGAGVYEFAGLAAWQSQHSTKGFAELAWLDLSAVDQRDPQRPVPLNPGVTRELLARILADPIKKAELRALLDEVNDPNPKAGTPTPPTGAVAADPASASRTS